MSTVKFEERYQAATGSTGGGARRTSSRRTSLPAEDLDAALGALPPGHAFTVPEVLFAKITDDQRAEWAERFAGVRD